MKNIYSKFAILEPMKNGELKDCAIISFYTPRKSVPDIAIQVDYSGFCDKVLYVGVPDIDEKCLADYGYTFDSYISDTRGLAEFIYEAKSNNLNIICQCEFGTSRSSACAAAILEHFEGRGNEIFSNDEYCPNILVYEKVRHALSEYEKCRKT